MAQDETSKPVVSDHSASTSDHLAEYQRHEGSNVPNSYIVRFKEGHTTAKHAAFLGRSFKMNEIGDGFGYWAEDVDDSLREQIRTDPGVDFIEDSFVAEDDWDDDDDELN